MPDSEWRVAGSYFEACNCEAICPCRRQGGQKLTTGSTYGVCDFALSWSIANGRSGTLERLMTMPLAKFDVLGGYGEAFALVAIVQALLVGAVAFGPLGLTAPHGVALVLALAVLNALLGAALGLFLSAFAATEFQAVQFLPAFVFPQLLLCGLLVPRDQMALPLRAAARALPMTYAYDALARAAAHAPLTPALTFDVVVLTALMFASVALGAATLQRRTP